MMNEDLVLIESVDDLIFYIDEFRDKLSNAYESNEHITRSELMQIFSSMLFDNDE